MPNVYKDDDEENMFDFLKPNIEITSTTTILKALTSTLTLTTRPISLTTKFNLIQQNKFNKQPEYLEQSTVSLCLNGKFDAISVLSDGFTYIFKDAYVFKIDSNFVMDREYPKLINNVFKGWNGLTYMNLPSNLDTVLFIPDSGMTYFFKNNLYWRSSKLFELDPGYPRLISENFRGLNIQNGFNGKLDASFVWSGNRRVYFVEKNRYWRYDFDLGSVEAGYPKRLSIWRGLPPRISEAFLWVNGITYFFDNEKYYRFNDLAFRVEEDAVPRYPRLNKDYWFGCNNLNKLGKLMMNSSMIKTSTDQPYTSREYVESERVEQSLNFTFIRATTSKINSEIPKSTEEITSDERMGNSDCNETRTEEQQDLKEFLKLMKNLK